MNRNKKFIYKDVVIVGVGFPDVLRIIDNINKKQPQRKINILGFFPIILALILGVNIYDNLRLFFGKIFILLKKEGGVTSKQSVGSR